MGTKYDAADFVVPPQIGDKGHSERIQCRIQSQHFRALNHMSRTGVFPWEERNDVVRWCIKVGLSKLADLEPGLLRSIMSQANAAERIAKEHIYMQKYTSTFDLLYEACRTYIANGMPTQAALVVRDMKRELQAMPERTEHDRAWKAEYLKKMSEYDRYLAPALEGRVIVGELPPKTEAPTLLAWDMDAFSSDDEEGEDNE